MKLLIAKLLLPFAFIGGLFHAKPIVSVPATSYQSLSGWQYDGPNATNSVVFGSISYPTSLDNFTNPAGTDSVATVSHATQHANANDGIEALEAKLGIGASTPTTGTLLTGTGTGISSWSATPSLTSLTLTNLLVNGSTTLQAFTAQTATTTNATTTNFYASGNSTVLGTASSTNLKANSGVISQLTVNSCSGCSTTAGVTIYVGTSTGSRYIAKTLNLVSGDLVTWTGIQDSGNNAGNLTFRISAPFQGSSTTVATNGSASANTQALQFGFLATTTETVTFSYQAGAAANNSMILMLQSSSYGNQI